MVHLLTLLLVFMIIGAILALTTKDLLSAVIAVGAVGFGCSVVFLLLKAPDVAITQIVVEVLTLVILIRATVGRREVTASGTRDRPGMAAVAALVLLFLVFGVMAMQGQPAFDFGTPVMARVERTPSAFFLANGLRKTGAANIVSSVLLDFRGYDTLGEATVLFTAIIGAVAVLRQRGRRSTASQEKGDAS